MAPNLTSHVLFQEGIGQNTNWHVTLSTEVAQALESSSLHEKSTNTEGRSGVICPREGCSQSLAHYDDLLRHIKNAHDEPSRYLCHFHRCPRGIPGHGFPCMDKLVDHLKSRKHELSHEEARYEAALHNPRRAQTQAQCEAEARRKDEASQACEAVGIWYSGCDF